MNACIIIDDEHHIVELLTGYVNKTAQLELKKTFNNPLQALEYLDKHEDIDLVFIDINMEELSGLEFVRIKNGKHKFIMVTAFEEYAVQGYENDIVDYLLKPVTFERFMTAVGKFNRRNNVGSTSTPKLVKDFLFVKGDQKGKYLKVKLNEVLYIEGLKNYVSISFLNNKLTTLMNMKDLELTLMNSGFIRIHRSFIVSISKIAAFNGGHLKLEGSDRLFPIGESYKEHLMKVLEI